MLYHFADVWVSIVFAGKDASRALAQSSLKPEDCRPEWSDLGEKEKTVLEEWYTFFSKRYNIVGKVEAAANL
jgi:membrane-associated progesterone receptor component